MGISREGAAMVEREPTPALVGSDDHRHRGGGRLLDEVHVLMPDHFASPRFTPPTSGRRARRDLRRRSRGHPERPARVQHPCLRGWVHVDLAVGTCSGSVGGRRRHGPFPCRGQCPLRVGQSDVGEEAAPTPTAARRRLPWFRAWCFDAPYSPGAEPNSLSPARSAREPRALFWDGWAPAITTAYRRTST
jgi:hypothetical protein